MVSPLWKACSDGDLEGVLLLLADPTGVDLEVKDHTGVTPLIEAVRNGHVDVVTALLNKGADPTNASSQGRPEQYTSDAVVLDLLKAAQQKLHATTGGPHENGFSQTHVANDYAPPPPPPPGDYAYYPTMNPAIPEPNVYYPPPPVAENGAPNGIGHLPPPEVARMIPCRYFPACRYGPQCMFAHPQGSYFQGGNMPLPNQYPPFDPSIGPIPYGYYPPPPPPPQFQQQPNGVPMAPLSPQQYPAPHARSPSEVISPSQMHFPNGAPPPLGPYVPLLPTNYPHPGVPMSGPPIPPLHHQPLPPPGPQSPTAIYRNIHAVPPYPGAEVNGHYMPPPPPGAGFVDPEGAGKTNVQQEGYPPHLVHRDGGGHRRGDVRRGSFVTKKPACLFFPAGRCKNGDDCRFPHILDTNAGPNHMQPFFVPRGNAPRPPRTHQHHPHHAPAVAGIEQKMATLSIQNDGPRPLNGVNDAPNRPRFQQGPKHHGNGLPNGNNKRPGLMFRQQRVPSADDFPVLPGLVTPPRTNGSSHAGPTAADILRAPAPVRKEASEDGTANASTRTPSPEATRDTTPEVETRGVHERAAASAPVAETEPAQQPHPVAAPQKLPVSFAAAAAATSATALTQEAATRVSISA